MTAPRFRNKTYRKVSVKVPGGKTVKQFKRRKPSKAVCGVCGKVLAGVPRERPTKMKNMPKTAKRPERPYGGVLCSKCSRVELVKKAQSLVAKEEA